MLRSATQAWICQATAVYVAAVFLVSHRKINVVSVLALFQKIIIIVKHFVFLVTVNVRLSLNVSVEQ